MKRSGLFLVLIYKPFKIRSPQNFDKMRLLFLEERSSSSLQEFNLISGTLLLPAVGAADKVRTCTFNMHATKYPRPSTT